MSRLTPSVIEWLKQNFSQSEVRSRFQEKLTSFLSRGGHSSAELDLVYSTSRQLGASELIDQVPISDLVMTLAVADEKRAAAFLEGSPRAVRESIEALRKVGKILSEQSSVPSKKRKKSYYAPRRVKMSDFPVKAGGHEPAGWTIVKPVGVLKSAAGIKAEIINVTGKALPPVTAKEWKAGLKGLEIPVKSGHASGVETAGWNAHLVARFSGGEPVRADLMKPGAYPQTVNVNAEGLGAFADVFREQGVLEGGTMHVMRFGEFLECPMIVMTSGNTSGR